MRLCTTVFVALFSAAAFAQSQGEGMTCTLEGKGFDPQPIPLVYDGMQKQFELPFVLRETAPDTLTFYRLSPDEVMPRYRQAQELARRAVHRTTGHVPIASRLSNIFRGIAAKRKVDQLFQVAEVKLFAEGGEVTPETYMRSTLKNASNWGTTEEMMNMREQIVRTCEPTTVVLRYLRFDRQLDNMPAVIRCRCGSFAIPSGN